MIAAMHYRMPTPRSVSASSGERPRGKTVAHSHSSNQPQDMPGTHTSANPALDYVRAITPHKGGRPTKELAQEFGLELTSIVKLASNENPLGMPDSAKAAIRAALDGDLARYPDGNATELKAALSSELNVPAGWITLGNGSNDILELAAAAHLAPGRSCVYAEYSFSAFAVATQSRGARHIVVPAASFGHDLDAMRAAIAPDTRLMYLANPNNPTGTFLTAERINTFLASVSRNVVVVLDEAYNEYLAPELRVDSAAWARKFPNLLVSRTFSKAYGLAGLRIGYGIAQPPLTDVLNRVRQPFNVSGVAQAAALAALRDKPFLARTYQINRDGMKQLTEALDRLHLESLPGFGNFMLVRVGDAAAVHLALIKRGVFVLPVANYGLPEWLRITVGLAGENERFIAALIEALR